MKRLTALLLTAATALAGVAVAGGPVAGHGWARATPPGANLAAVYLVLDNTGGGADRLLSVATPAAERTEVHETLREGDVLRMRRVDPLHLRAGEKLAFEPGGLHVMLMGLRAPLVEGRRIPLTLTFERAGTVQVEATVVAGDATDPHAGHHH
jgi:copper(I)-binding protein